MEKKGYKKFNRRTLLGGVIGAAVLPINKVLAKSLSGFVPDDPTKQPGRGPGKLGQRSKYEHPVKSTSDISSRTPLQDFYSTITPSDLHYERHHAGVPDIDP